LQVDKSQIIEISIPISQTGDQKSPVSLRNFGARLGIDWNSIVGIGGGGFESQDSRDFGSMGNGDTSPSCDLDNSFFTTFSNVL